MNVEKEKAMIQTIDANGRMEAPLSSEMSAPLPVRARQGEARRGEDRSPRGAPADESPL
jgi:hypothetical protein